MIFKNDKIYDTLKFLSWTLIPISAFIAELGEIINIPMMKTISAIMIALNACVGVLLKTSNDAYNKVNGSDVDED